MKKVITIAGSNSQNSINKTLIKYAATLLEDAKILNIDLNDYVLPIYGVDYEAENRIPTTVKRLDEILNSADAFIISLAEHNGSYAAVFKNIIDWLSRIDMKIWKEKPMLLMTTSPGERGGTNVLQLASNYFPFLGAKILETYSLPSFYDNFKEGEIIEENLRKELKDKIASFSKGL
ncbi:NAD(P)H-dependent oxidoreductase [uncultured Maribacter sp.]|uniref:NADPH-dependent FMN reductase n=1 Tax=uncultured Maribacter sp. TaxID=431308 RepID=UPI00260D8670|nr:NAD(P)H-dependent oxidoreductase [uncultured Maribacter sp.]